VIKSYNVNAACAARKRPVRVTGRYLNTKLNETVRWDYGIHQV